METELRQRYWGRLIGRRLRVLVETPLAGRPGWMLGTACRYAPVQVPAEPSARRQFVDVVAQSLTDDCIRGVLPA